MQLEKNRTSPFRSYIWSERAYSFIHWSFNIR